MHHVRLAADKVTDYQIVAPTEWNFHPDGAFAQDLRGLVEPDEEQLRRLAHIEAMSLDPCVAYEIEIRDH
jgi:Ni,Fe-hydrogenase I large subunit